MKIGFLLLTLLAISSCTDSVLDPSELGSNDGSATGNTDLVFYNQEVVNFAGGSPHILQTFSLKTGSIDVITTQGFMTSPPIGKKLLYIDDSVSDQHKLYISDLDGNNLQYILTDDLIESAALSPDGNSILYTVSYEDPYTLVPYSLIKLISVLAPANVQIIADSGDPSIMPTFSPNGQYIAYAQLDPNRVDKLSIYSINGRSTTSIDIGLTPFSVDLEFDWTSDSKKILCLSNQDVALYDLASTTITPLNFTAGLPIFPVISPDGQIAVVGYDIYGIATSDIYLYNGSGWDNITNTSDSSEVLPHFSADGKKLVFSAIAGGLDPFTTQAVLPSTMKVYESGTIRTLDQGMIVRPLFGR